MCAAENNTFAEKMPNPAGWKLIEGAVKILEPVKVLAKKFEADTRPSSNEVVSGLYDLQDFLTNFQKKGSNIGSGKLFAKELQKQLHVYLAKHFLSIPASSATSERVFSHAGFIVSDRRCSLNEDKVEDILMIKLNINRLEEEEAKDK